MKQSKNVAELLPYVTVQLNEASVEKADPDECQLIDESDKKWVQAWREKVKAIGKREEGLQLSIHLIW
jgi:hypothetical protein